MQQVQRKAQAFASTFNRSKNSVGVLKIAMSPPAGRHGHEVLAGDLAIACIAALKQLTMRTNRDEVGGMLFPENGPRAWRLQDRNRSGA